MAFDAEGYRQAAKEAGISDDVIKRTIAEQSAGVKDVATKPTQQDVSVEMFPNLVKQVMEYAPEAIGAYLGYKALTSDTAKSVGKSIKDRMIGAPKQPTRIEPTMEGPKEPTFSPPSKVGPVTDLPGTPEELQKALGPNWEATLAKSEAARKEKQMLAQERARTSMGEIPAPAAQPPIAGGQPPAPSPVAQVAAQTAPVAPPTVSQIAQQVAPAITEAAQAPAAAVPPAEKNKGGAPTKEKRSAAPFYLNKEEIRKAQGEQNSYLNMLGYDKKNPDSPRSQAAKVSFEMFLNEGLEGKVQRGVSGKPVSHEGVYKPWLEKNFQFLPEQTQVFLLEQQQKATKRGVIPPVPLPVGAAVPPSSGGGGGFLQKPTTPGGMLHNLNPLRLE